MTDTIASLKRKVKRMSDALKYIRYEECEKTWGQGYACITDKSRSIERFEWCDSCVAHNALKPRRAA